MPTRQTQTRARSRKSRKDRFNCELRKELGKKLLGYSAAAGAAITLGAGAAEAVAIKTTPGTPVTVGVGGSFNLDIDDSGTNDFGFMVVFNSTGSGFNRNNGYVFAAQNNSILANSSSVSMAANLNLLAPVYSTRLGTFGSSAILGGFYNFGSVTITNGNFVGSRGFLGVGFDISGDTHYGWVDVELSSNASLVTIRGWGYETDLATEILAGAGQESQPVPEPATLLTLAMGAAGIYAWRRNRKRKGLKNAAQKEHQNS